jgi:hypothetical protein
MAVGCPAIGVLTAALVSFVSCTALPRPATIPEAALTPVEQPATGSQFVATEELKKKTFDEVSQIIDSLDHIIAQSDYETWLGFLTKDYVDSRSSDTFLRQASDSAVLRKSGKVLRTLRDYFENVVVQSRERTTLADITFVDATHVKAYTRIQGTLYILYYLVREDGRWKIGVLPTGES